MNIKKALDTEKEIYYIMGTGRSGSTILDMLLSNQPDVVGCGEITHLFDVDTLQDRCACGAEVRRCPVWHDVVNDLSDNECAEINRLIRRTEAHGRFFTIAARLPGSDGGRRYYKIQTRLFGTLFNQGFKAVVDSSKYASRALLLRRIFGERLKVICLTRSPEGLLAAFAKQDMEQPPKSTWSTLLYYLYTMSCFAVVRWILRGDVAMVRYEDLISVPLETLDSIESGLDICLDATHRKLLSSEALDTGHIAVGNRIRRHHQVYFKQGLRPQRVGGPACLSVMVMRAYGRLLGFKPYKFKE